MNTSHFKKTLAIALVTFSVNSFADCTYSINKDKSVVSWTAFKTPKKVGVKGSFTKFQIKTSASKSELDLIKNATFEIDTTSVATGNGDRDKKIVNFFFTNNKRPVTIKGKVIEVTNTSTKVMLNISNQEKEVILQNEIKDGKIVLSGTIDVLDYKLNSNLQAINQACKELHEGKTWSDVNINLEAEYSKKCN